MIDRPTYIIPHLGGSRVQFITTMILHLHRQITDVQAGNELGNSHEVAGRYLFTQTTFYSMQQREDFAKAPTVPEFIGTGDDPFIMHVFYGDIDYQSLLQKYSNIKYININVLPSQLIELCANEFYKTTIHVPDWEFSKIMFEWYSELAKNDPKCRTNLTKIDELNEYESMILIKYYTSIRLNSFETLDKERLAAIPKEIPFYNIEYSDILSNKEKVLSTLEDMTGYKRNSAIEKSYDVYNESQKPLQTTKLSWLYGKE